ncbi:MAG: sulfatase/phosphatase domain-containing protein [Candidatus Sumerlaeia bacterium]
MVLYVPIESLIHTPCPDGRDGQSLLLWSREKKPDNWRTELAVETQVGFGPRGPGGDLVGRVLMDERYKYICYNRGKYREQFFDLQEDPGEMVNLAVESQHAELLQKCRDRLETWCNHVGDKRFSHDIPGVHDRLMGF